MKKEESKDDDDNEDESSNNNADEYDPMEAEDADEYDDEGISCILVKRGVFFSCCTNVSAEPHGYNSQIKTMRIPVGGIGGMTAAMIENQEIDHLKIK